MIVNPTQNGWEVIYQPAHALLAAQIATHWRANQRPKRWLETTKPTIGQAEITSPTPARRSISP